MQPGGGTPGGSFTFYHSHKSLQQVVGYKLTFAENGRAPELAGAFRGGWRSVTTPSTAGEKSAGADLEQMRSKQRASFESRWTRIEKFVDSFHSGGWEH